MRCPVCSWSTSTFLYDSGDGHGKYECDNCGVVFIDPSPFVELDDEEAEAMSELALGDDRNDLAEELANRRKFAEGKAREIRSLTGGYLETTEPDRHSWYPEIQEVYDRITDSLYETKT